MEVKAVLCLFWISVQRVSSSQEILESQRDVTGDADVDFKRLENEYAVGNISTGTEIYENTTVPENIEISTEKPQTKSDNITEFRPSWHLGEIEEFRNVYSNPFNKPSQLKFDNSLSVLPEVENWNSAVIPSKKDEADHKNINHINDNINLLAPAQSNFFPSSIADGNPYFQIHKNGASIPRGISSFQTQNVVPTVFPNFPHLPPSLQRPAEFPPNFPDKTYFETTYGQEIPPPLDRPESFYDEPNFDTPFRDVPNFNSPKLPNFDDHHQPNDFRGHSEVQEILPTRNHRFPYKFHHETPTFADGNLEYIADEQVFHNVLRERRISPWKRIIHLIGSILPFGLLLAALTPNVVQISNSTQSIPLSKYKEVILPPEHKGSRMADDPTNCEEKNICEVILAGSKPNSNLLQNILWNFVLRTPEGTAKDNGLRELFQAVKKRDCNAITC